MDSDIRSYTIRDPRANNSNTPTIPPVAVPQLPPQAVQTAPRPQAVQQPPKPGSSTDNEKVIFF